MNSLGPKAARAGPTKTETRVRPRALAALQKGHRLTDQSKVGSITIA